MKMAPFSPPRPLGGVSRIHFVGIGGAGMSGIAALLISLKYRVSGSDLKETSVTESLRRAGAVVHIGHRASHAAGADVVVVSAAVPSDNPEIVEARRRGIPVIPRTEMLAELMRLKYGIAVSGTHGKTTTTSMVGMVMREGGMDPTLVIGGQVDALRPGRGTARSPYLVAEACEAFGEFFLLSPVLSVVTNVDDDHLDTYGSLEKVREAFTRFANQVPFYGCVVAGADDPEVRRLLPDVKRRVVTFGLSRGCAVRAVKVKARGFGTSFEVLAGGRRLGAVRLAVPGLHNVRNALAALAVGLELGVPFRAAARGLARFTGVHRRFEVKGECRGALVVDDYAHHPTEVEACLAAARQVAGKGKVWCVFQPHLYSRTKLLREKFGRAFHRADSLWVLDVYPAREKPLPGVTGEIVAQAAREAGHPTAAFAPDREALAGELRRRLGPGIVLVLMGAGDVGRMADLLSLKRRG